jgi:hydrogenase maturation factor HypF (carbamoyltransferase family)
MDDFYARTYGLWNPRRSQKDAIYCSIYPQYDDYGVMVPYTNRIPVLTKKVPVYAFDSENESESDADFNSRKAIQKAEKAAETKMKAKEECEKAKTKLEEAKKALEDCEAKLKTASKKLNRYATVLGEHRYGPRRHQVTMSV